MDALLSEPRFRRQLAAEERLLAMPDAEWAARQAVERALADGKVSTVDTLLRASLVLPALTAKPATLRGKGGLVPPKRLKPAPAQGP